MMVEKAKIKIKNKTADAVRAVIAGTILHASSATSLTASGRPTKTPTTATKLDADRN